MKPLASFLILPVSTSTLTTSLLNHLGPYNLPSGPQSIPFKPQYSPISLKIVRGSLTPFESNSKSPLSKKHWATNNLSSSEKVIGFTPSPGFPATTFSPLVLKPATSPVSIDVQKNSPFELKATSSGPITPSDRPYLLTMFLFSVSMTVISEPITDAAYRNPSGPKCIPFTPAISAPVINVSSF